MALIKPAEPFVGKESRDEDDLEIFGHEPMVTYDAYAQHGKRLSAESVKDKNCLCITLVRMNDTHSHSDHTPGAQPSSTRMKPMTAAKKLNIFLPAAPEEFQKTALTHDEFVGLQNNPPQWLKDLRANGPHPRAEVARKLGITAAALKRNDMDKPLTTAEINSLLSDRPEWLREERKSLAEERERRHAANESRK